MTPYYLTSCYLLPTAHYLLRRYQDPWPVVRYRIRLKRASSYYVPGYVAPPVERGRPSRRPPPLEGRAL